MNMHEISLGKRTKYVNIMVICDRLDILLDLLGWVSPMWRMAQSLYGSKSILMTHFLFCSKINPSV